VRLLGNGELKAKLDITVWSATASAVKAVEAAGGKITQLRPVKAEAAAEA
jgi:large subunit ribosomal protein L15